MGDPDRSSSSRRQFLVAGGAVLSTGLAGYQATRQEPFPSLGPLERLEPVTPAVYRWPRSGLEAVRASPPSGLLETWTSAGDRALERDSVSVVDGGATPPSGDPQDYQSLSIYWWPNPISGTPYYQRDGRRNPEAEQSDSARLSRLIGDVTAQTLAWWLTDDPAYASGASAALERWFLDPETRMHPHLRYGQRLPGWLAGAPWGLTETANVAMTLLEAVALLGGAAAWTIPQQQGLRDWLAQYLGWLLDSPKGWIQRRAHNNHGFYYDLQVARLALAVGDERLATAVLDEVVRWRIDHQVEADGRMPAELERTRSFDYTVYTLRALFGLAEIAASLEIDLWGHNDQSIRTVLDYALETSADWPHPQIGSIDRSALAPYSVPGRHGVRGRALSSEGQIARSRGGLARSRDRRGAPMSRRWALEGALLTAAMVGAVLAWAMLRVMLQPGGLAVGPRDLLALGQVLPLLGQLEWPGVLVAALVLAVGWWAPVTATLGYAVRAEPPLPPALLVAIAPVPVLVLAIPAGGVRVLAAMVVAVVIGWLGADHLLDEQPTLEPRLSVGVAYVVIVGGAALAALL
ncbi:MAG: alginate lyase family protein [Natrialbaceae archaeon]|nr:alginate lyase family protein [Natrialbaceae archaeon]